MSELAEMADNYLALRRSLGYKLDEAGRLLPRFVAYLDAIGAETVTIENALEWSQQPNASSTSTVWEHRMRVTRGFARHLVGIDPRTQVPPAGLISCPQRRRTPYIYSPTDVATLRAQARLMIPSPLRAATFDTVIGLLAVTGMRIGEVIAIERSDIDWSEDVLMVRESKFGKSRLVPVHPTTTAALTAYAQERDRRQPTPKSPSFFVSTVGTRLAYNDVAKTFHKMVDCSGVAAGSSVRPRLHDLRHTFAVYTLVRWYREGHDVHARLPWLSTYLGHREPRYTYWYLTAIPELLALAASRLEAAKEAKS
ncbi:MAG: tyrosine-type recombinase/integrase [Acidimicrobiales bacterium]|jgi:integrase